MFWVTNLGIISVKLSNVFCWLSILVEYKVYHSSVSTFVRYSRPYLQMKSVPNDIIQNVETHLTIGAEPLLTHLTTEVEFTEVMLLEFTECLQDFTP